MASWLYSREIVGEVEHHRHEIDEAVELATEYPADDSARRLS